MFILSHLEVTSYLWNNINFKRLILYDSFLENEKIPSFMEPFNGIGLSEQHPAILLALLVRKSDKKKMKPKP